LEVNPEGGRAVLTDLAGRVRDGFTNERLMGSRDIGPFLGDVLHEGRRRAERMNIPLRGIGMGIPGVVDPRTGAVARSRPLGISAPRDIAGELAVESGLRVTVENDADCCCRGELSIPEEKTSGSFILIWGETRRRGLAVGFGTVIGGVIHRGDHGAGGEFLSAYVDEGREQFALDKEVLSRAARDNGAMKQVADELAPQVAMIANLLDIDLVIFGGFFKRRFDVISGLFQTTLEKRRTYPGLAQPRIRPAARDEDAVAYGAAIRFLDHLDEILTTFNKE
jgi:predicted NBD/HSP70 family sugar kinase